MQAERVEAVMKKIGLSQELSPGAEYEKRHEDYVMEMPQSGERIVGRDNMRTFQENFPTPPKIEVREIREAGDLVVLEATNDYEGKVFHAVMILEFQEGKIVRDTRYYAEPFEPPEWRSEWVELEEP